MNLSFTMTAHFQMKAESLRKPNFTDRHVRDCAVVARNFFADAA